MSFSSANAFPLPIAALQYRDIGLIPEPEVSEEDADSTSGPTGKSRNRLEISEVELEARIRQERSDAVMQVEQQLRDEYEQKLQIARKKVATALEEFQAQRTDYFSRVEAEVVQLALSIAAKILRREAQVDPMLIAALVKMAVEKMSESSSVSVRVRPGAGTDWKPCFAGSPVLSRVEVIEDAQVEDGDCILETELGRAHFGLEAQLKEVERGFFDLLALRPVAR